MIRTLLLCLCLTGCFSPTYLWDGEWGEVRAKSEDEARRVGSLIDARTEELARLLGVEPLRVEVLVMPRWYLDHGLTRVYGAVTDEGQVLLSRSALGDYGHRVLHEVVHAQLQQEPWRTTLPWVIEEGIAEVASLRVSGELDLYERQVRRGYRGPAMPLEEAWAIEIGDLEGDGTSFYVCGFEAVRRVGLERVLELAREGRLQPADFMHR